MKKDLLLLLAIAFAILFGHTVLASSVTSIRQTKTVEVKNGDTLWSIASKSVQSNVDIREYIYEIKTMNHLNDVGELQPGTVLTLPK